VDKKIGNTLAVAAEFVYTLILNFIEMAIKLKTKYEIEI